MVDSLLSSSELRTASAGFLFVRRLLESRGFKIRSTDFANNDRHCFFDTNDGLFYVIFKRDFIHSFNYFKECESYLKSFPSDAGFGESINVDCLNRALSHGVCSILYVYSDCSVYTVSPLKIKTTCSEFGMVRVQDRSFSYRVPDGRGLNASVRETEFVFPVRWLRRF